MSASDVRRCVAEVVDLHRALEKWLSGDGDRSDRRTIQRVIEPFASDFCLVTPNGKIETRSTLAQRLETSFGAAPGIRIRIEDVTTVSVAEGVTLVRYLERRKSARESTVRVSSALLADDAGQPHGITWLHLQETWVIEDR